MAEPGFRLRKPPHPGAFVKTEIVEAHDLSVTEAARILGVTRPTLSQLLNERAALSPEMALRLEKAFGIRMDTLMRMQSTYDIAETRSREKQIEVKPFVPKANNVSQARAP